MRKTKTTARTGSGSGSCAQDTVFWQCRDYSFRQHGGYVVLEGYGTPPVLSAGLLRKLARALDQKADELEAMPPP